MSFKKVSKRLLVITLTTIFLLASLGIVVCKTNSRAIDNEPSYGLSYIVQEGQNSEITGGAISREGIILFEKITFTTTYYNTAPVIIIFTITLNIYTGDFLINKQQKIINLAPNNRYTFLFTYDYFLSSNIYPVRYEFLISEVQR